MLQDDTSADTDCKQLMYCMCCRKQTAGTDTDSKWSRLLTEQQRLQQAEVHRWHQVLLSAIQLVEQMQRILCDLHDGVMRRTDDIVALTERSKRVVESAADTSLQADESGASLASDRENDVVFAR